MAGHNCDNCGRELKQLDYFVHGGWSYNCSRAHAVTLLSIIQVFLQQVNK